MRFLSERLHLPVGAKTAYDPELEALHTARCAKDPLLSPGDHLGLLDRDYPAVVVWGTRETLAAYVPRLTNRGWDIIHHDSVHGEFSPDK